MLENVKNPLIKHTTKIWHDNRLMFKTSRKIHRSTQFHFNPALPMSLRDGIMKNWYNRGIYTFGHLFEKEEL